MMGSNWTLLRPTSRRLGVILAAVALLALARLVATVPLAAWLQNTENQEALTNVGSVGGEPIKALAPDAALRAPLFDPNRQALGTAIAETSGPLGGLRLQGVILARGNRIAHVLEGKSDTIHKLREGQTFNGLIVNEIKADRIIFLDKGTRLELTLFEPQDADITK